MSTSIQEFKLHPIELSKEKAEEQSVPKDAELTPYIISLLEWAYSEEDSRQFKFDQKTTEVRAAIQKVIEGQPLSSVAAVIANRLLRQEKQAEKEVARLKGIHEGMLLQATFARDGTKGLLLAKVDLSEYLGKKNLRSESGIDKKHRILKFCIIEFSAAKDIKTVQVGDTNSIIATYWWKDFLELTEVLTDSTNTKNAFASFDLFLGRQLSKKYPRDYPALFNEVLRQFKRPQPFKFSKFLDAVFDHYRPYHTDLDVQELKRHAKELLNQKKFDSNFTILPQEVEKRFKKTYTLSPQIEVTVVGELKDVADEISAFALDDGTKGVFIKSEKGFDQFPPHKTVQRKATLTSILQTHSNLKNEQPVTTAN